MKVWVEFVGCGCIVWRTESIGDDSLDQCSNEVSAVVLCVRSTDDERLICTFPDESIGDDDRRGELRWSPVTYLENLGAVLHLEVELASGKRVALQLS